MDHPDAGREIADPATHPQRIANRGPAAPKMQRSAAMSTDPKEQQAKHEATKSADKDDVHEQREMDQKIEGIVEDTVVESGAKKKG